MKILVLRASVALAAISTAFAGEPAADPSREMARLTAENLMAEISDWLTSTQDLPLVGEKPKIRFTSDVTLQELWHQQSANPHIDADVRASEVTSNGHPGGIVALYDNSRHTIFLSDSWTGTSPAEQSVLVHEMVHHVQHVARLPSECPMAREKLAYRAQNRWPSRFGMDLQSEFGLDPFTVLINSACI